MPDYKFGLKNNWRRWVWNRIAERVHGPKRDAVVLYLPGPADLDRPEALRRGFMPDNLIGIERDRAVMRDLRGGGGLCVQADFLKAVPAFSPSRKVGVVYGDFMCGLEERFIAELVMWTCLPHLRDTVFAFNFLRGRDPSSNEIRKTMVEQFKCGKHRGETLITYLALMALSDFTNACESHQIEVDEERQKELVIALDREWRPAIYSYKSGPQVFDSVVWKNTGAIANIGAGSLDDDRHWRKVSQKFQGVERRKLAAALAHRTMRMSA